LNIRCSQVPLLVLLICLLWKEIEKSEFQEGHIKLFTLVCYGLYWGFKGKAFRLKFIADLWVRLKPIRVVSNLKDDFCPCLQILDQGRNVLKSINVISSILIAHQVLY
jgi:hypothetical protein